MRGQWNLVKVGWKSGDPICKRAYKVRADLEFDVTGQSFCTENPRKTANSSVICLLQLQY